jgi:hypothetical protein
MVVFLFGDCSNLVGEFESLGEVLELKDPLQPLDSINFLDLPLRDLRPESLNFALGQGRLASAAGHAL